MIYNLRFTNLKRLALALVFSTVAVTQSLAQNDGFVFLCDSNGVGLPGFYLNWSNLVGSASTAQLPTNVVISSQLLSVSNTLATNFTSTLNTVSNNAASLQNWIDGTNNIFGAPGGSNVLGVGATLALGGYANTIYVNTGPSAFVLAGTSNTMVSASPNGGMLGGQLNRIDYSPQSAILGGTSSYLDLSTNSAILFGLSGRIDYSATRGVIIGGATNTIFGGINNVILGGANNTIGQSFGWNGVFDGPLTANNSCAGGVGAWPVFSGSFIWCDDQGATNWLRNTTNNQVIFRAKNGFGINTNFTGTNALAVNGNGDFSSISIGGVGIGTLYSPTVTSNGLSTLWNYNLTTASNALQTQITSALAQDVTTSNNLAAQIVATNTALVTLVAATSNSFAASIGPAKAFTATLPATYSSIGIGFSTPLMPDGNYSVTLTPQDQNTAEAPLNGMSWWVGSKNNSGFTIYAAFATNAYNLNFECQVKENTQ